MHTRNPGWRSGDHWMTCDLCGFHYRSSQMKKDWRGYWVCEKDFSIKHPQYDVRGKKDRMNVPYARPDPTDLFNSTTLTADAAKGATTIAVADATYIDEYNSIGIVLDTEFFGSSDNIRQWTYVTDVTGLNVTLAEGLNDAASSGNTVYTRGNSYTYTAVS